MEKSIFIQTAKFLRERRDDRRWRAVVFCLAVIVIGGTAWILSKKGQALTRAEDVLCCQLTVHEHTEECYDEEGKLSCGMADYVFHQHDKSCYDEEGGLVCQLPEIEKHIHNEDCFEAEAILVCGYEESSGTDEEEPKEEEKDPEGTVTEELICSQEEHTHDESCYEYETEKTFYEETIETLDCGQQEHTHSDDCYDEEGGLTCGQEEHTHNGDCYVTETITHEQEGEEKEILACGQEEHSHSDACYSTTVSYVQEETESDLAAPANEHEHDESCYRTVRKLVCSEKGAHTHDESCYDESGSIVCGAPYVEYVEEHVHDEDCFKPADETEGMEYTKTFENDDILITVVYTKSANIPAEAALTADITFADSDSAYFDQCLKLLESTEGVLSKEETLAMLLKLRFCTDDEIFVPEDKIVVTVQFLRDVVYTQEDALKAAYITEEGAALIGGADTGEERAITFTMEEEGELAFIVQEESNARTLIYEGEDYIITAALLEDTGISEGAELYAYEITEESDAGLYEQYLEALKEAELLNEEEMIGKLLSVGISVDGKEIAPEEAMDIRIQFLTNELYFEGDEVKGAHFAKERTELISASDIDGEGATLFTIDELGCFAFISNSDIRIMTYEGEDFIVTVRFGKDALIPENAELLARRITKESDPEHFAERQKQVQNEITDELIAVEALFEIGFYVEGEEIEPRDTVDVKIQLLDHNTVEKDDPIKVVHFAEDGLEIFDDAGVIEAEENGLSTSFQLDSFSEVAVIRNGEVTDAESFRWAIENAKDGDVIEVKEDFTFSISERLDEDGNKLEELKSAKLKLNEGETSKRVTLNLNGHKIQLDGDITLVDVEPGTHLIVEDRTAGQPEEIANGGSEQYSYVKNTNGDPGVFTYSVTESNTSGYGRTEERLCTYRITNCGAIVGSADNNSAVFYVAGGHLTMQSGVIYGNSARAINAETAWWNTESRPSLELLGGYLVSNSSPYEGGAITLSNGDLTLVNTVIAGSTANRGGGICASGSVVTINGGYISNNTSNYVTDWAGGGGGVFVCKCTLTINGGHITGNKSNMGGGGIAADAFDWEQRTADNRSIIRINNGYISGNEASANSNRGEGGGIGIYDASTMAIGDEANGMLYITNNAVSDTYDWGGGGIFIGELATAELYHTLVTNNTAEGFGGGVGGCSTGRIFDFDYNGTGMAVFDNTAFGNAFAGSTSAKNDQDKKHTGENEFSEQNPAFWRKDENGKYLFQDYFSVLYSYIVDKMLGGGSQGWDGSIDGAAIDKEAGSWLSSYVIGLTAHPSAEDKENAKNAAHIFISGNHSDVHGGGIMCNGIMIIGERSPETTEVEIGSAANLRINKQLEGGFLQPGQFEFTIYQGLKDGKLINPLYEGTNGDAIVICGNEIDAVNHPEHTPECYGCNISFNEPLTFDLKRDFKSPVTDTEYTYEYYIKEDSVSDHSGNIDIIGDDTIYRIIFTVKKVDKGSVITGRASLEGVTKYVDEITNITVYKSQNMQTWEQVTEGIETPTPDEDHIMTIALPGIEFVNKQASVTEFEVEKIWNVDSNHAAPENVDSIRLELYQTSKEDATNSTLVESINLSRKNDWNYRWEKLDADYNYTVKEVKIVYTDGSEDTRPENKYEIEYEYKNEKKEDGNLIAKVRIVNTPKPYRITLEKTGITDNAENPLSGAKFELYVNDSKEALKFEQRQGSYTYYEGEVRPGLDTTLVTDAAGKLNISGLPEGTYTLKEIQAPAGYKPINPHKLMLSKGTAKVECLRNGCKDTVSIGNGDAGNEFILKVTDQEDKYELPETGGFGPLYINILGAVLLCGIAALMYKTYRRRREGAGR